MATEKYRTIMINSMRENLMLLEVRDTREGSLGLRGGLLSQITITNPRTYPPTSNSMNRHDNKAHNLSFKAMNSYKAQCNYIGLKDMIHKPLNRHA